MYRGEKIEKVFNSQEFLEKYFGGEEYKDVAGLCKVVFLDEIKGKGYSLNPGRYVGVPEGLPPDYDFEEKMEKLNEELEQLNNEARHF